MGERKVLNRYFPPDFDPSKLPKRKRPDTNDMKVRMMLPMSVRCKTCGNFMYKGTKFNTRKEDVLGENYLGIQIYRFYYRCTSCAAEFTMKTDPKNTDYVLEQGATRNYEHWREEERTKEEIKKEREEEEMGNAMKALENRTLESKREMDILAALDEMRTLNARHNKISTEEALAALRREAEKQAGPSTAAAAGDADLADDMAEFYRLKRAAAARELHGSDSDDEAGANGQPSGLRKPSSELQGASSSAGPSNLTNRFQQKSSRTAGIGVSLAATALEEELEQETAGNGHGVTDGLASRLQGQGGADLQEKTASQQNAEKHMQQQDDNDGISGGQQDHNRNSDPLASSLAEVRGGSNGSGNAQQQATTASKPTPVFRPQFKVNAKPKPAAAAQPPVTTTTKPEVTEDGDKEDSGEGLPGLLGDYGSSSDSG